MKSIKLLQTNHSKKKNKLLFDLIISICVFAAVTIMYAAGTFSYLENKLYDHRISKTASWTKPHDDICFIGVDQESINQALSQMGWSWPWPREAYAQIIDFLTEGNASSVMIDVLFTEPSIYGGEDDHLFAEACKRNGRVIQTHLFSNGNNLLPVEPVKSESAMLGNINGTADDDGIIRSAKLAFTRDGTTIPTLGISPLVLDGKVSAADSDKSLLLHYKGDINRYAHYSAWEILESYNARKNGKTSWLEPEDFENSYVFILFYAPGLYDICATPVSKTYPGGGVHMTLLDNYLNGDFMKKCPPFVTVLLTFVFAVGAVVLVMLSEKRFSKRSTFVVSACLILCIVLYGGYSYFLFTRNIFLEIVPPVISLTVTLFLSVLLNYNIEGKKRRFIQTAFGQYLSPKVIEKLIDNPEKLKLGGVKTHLSIMFSDIQSFTTLSESMEPEKLTELLNLYLSEMSRIIIESGGTVDKYIGDAIVAFWNAPAEVENHGAVAVSAGLEYQKRLCELNRSIKEKYGVEIKARIGLNTGDAVVGNMGSDLRFDYSMFGDSVNLASRLEGLNKQFGTYFMCSQQTKKEAEGHLSDVYFRKIGKIVVVGKSEPITVYEPLNKADYVARKDFYDSFEEAVSLFYQGNFTKARIIFEKYMQSDKACALYAEKCNLYTESKESWKGYLVSNKK